jgi:hypothetical protein
MEDDSIEKTEFFGQTQFQSAFDDRTNKGLEAGVGVSYLQAVASAHDPYRQHSTRMNNLDRAIDGVASDYLSIRMLRFPFRAMIQGRGFQNLSISSNQVFYIHIALLYYIQRADFQWLRVVFFNRSFVRLIIGFRQVFRNMYAILGLSLYWGWAEKVKSYPSQN